MERALSIVPKCSKQPRSPKMTRQSLLSAYSDSHPLHHTPLDAVLGRFRWRVLTAKV